MPRLLLVLALLTLAVWPGHARADTIAASLYEEGIKLLKEKRFEEACSKLDASFNREPLSGTLMVSAQCHELLGETTDAYNRYQRAARLAVRERRESYQATAKERAQKLEPKVARVLLQLAPGARLEGLRVTLSGEPFELDQMGTPRAVAPGEVAVTASAPGHQTWSSAPSSSKLGQLVTVAVPVLAPEQAQRVVVAPPTPPPDRGIDPAPPSDQADEGGGVPAWAWVVGSAGIVMAGVSVGFLVDNLAAISQLRDRCSSDPNGGDNDYLCDAGYDADADNARKNRSGPLALGLGIGAVVALTASIIGIATAPGDSASSEDDTGLGNTGIGARLEIEPMAGPPAAGTVGGLQLRGSF